MQRSTCLIALTTLGTLACSGPTGPSAQEPLPVPGTRELVLGNEVPLDKTGYRLRLESIEGDSRCPIEATCIWAGRVTLRATLVAEPGLGSPDFPLTLRSDSLAIANGLELRLTRVLPLPHAGLTIPAGAYRLTIAVAPADQ